jgi:hypothetical protein
MRGVSVPIKQSAESLTLAVKAKLSEFSKKKAKLSDSEAYESRDSTRAAE